MNHVIKVGRFLIAFVFLASGNCYSRDIWNYGLQTGTALHETNDDFAFAVLPTGDLVAIKKSGTGTKSTEVHILKNDNILKTALDPADKSCPATACIGLLEVCCGSGKVVGPCLGVSPCPDGRQPPR